MAGIGVIIRDWHGEAIATLSLPIPLSHNVNELEALACRRGVQFAGEIGFRKVIFEGDSSVVINALSQGSGGFASYGNTLRISSSLLLISSFFISVMLKEFVMLWPMLLLKTPKTCWGFGFGWKIYLKTFLPLSFWVFIDLLSVY